MDKKRKEEEDFKAKVAANPEWKKEYGDAWEMDAKAIDKEKSRIKEQFYRATDSQLALLAINVVTYVAEIKKPDGERLPGFHESQLDSLKHRMFSPAPVYPELEIARISSALQADLDGIGPADPWVKAVLAGRTPKQAATELVTGSKLADPAVRKALVDGGQAAIDASTDP